MIKKKYETPSVEVVEMASAAILAGSDNVIKAGDTDSEDDKNGLEKDNQGTIFGE